MPDRPLPTQPSLEQQKKLAKELHRELRAGDSGAHERLRRYLPDRRRVTLADAQFILAREYGFENWASLRSHIQQVSGGASASLEGEFRRAFAACDAAAVRALLQSHPAARQRIDAPLFPFDSPALAHFAGDGNLAMVEVLLEFGADPNRRTSWWAGGFHPLHRATGAVADRLLAAGAVPDACATANLDRPDLLRRLLDEDADRVHERGGDGQTPLHFARSHDVIDLLLDRGADIDARDVDHRSTPAQWMLARECGAGRYDLAHYLAGRGASIDIFLAAALGLTKELRRMTEADPSVTHLRTGQVVYGQEPPGSFHIYFWTIGPNLSPLQVAAQFEQQDAVDVLRACAPATQLFINACAAGDAGEAARLLHERPGLVDEFTPDDHRALADAAWKPDPHAVGLMLDLGFDPAVPGHDGGTALHCASWQGSVAAVEALLRHPAGRALVNARDTTYNATPLGWCAHGAEHSGRPTADHAAVERLLLEAGASPE
ncbi:hypothetical protein BH23GEM9_BH23GEM9_28270 [soil metagenome]